jgi:hypothetical protein
VPRKYSIVYCHSPCPRTAECTSTQKDFGVMNPTVDVSKVVELILSRINGKVSQRFLDEQY